MCQPHIADKFVCAGCGQNIISLPPQIPPPTLCATCLWLDEFVPDPAERERVRARLNKEI